MEGNQDGWHHCTLSTCQNPSDLCTDNTVRVVKGVIQTPHALKIHWHILWYKIAFVLL
jgi:hypothetical protein